MSSRLPLRATAMRRRAVRWPTIYRPRGWRFSISRSTTGPMSHCGVDGWCSLSAQNSSSRLQANSAQGPIAPECDKVTQTGRVPRYGQQSGFAEAPMFRSILVPLDLADTDLARPAIETAATLSQTWNGKVRLLHVLPMTPVMLAEYVPADFDVQQRDTSEEALAIVARESGIDANRISIAVRQGGIYPEILEEAAAVKADLIVMTSHRPAMRTYFLGSNAGHVVRYAKCSVLVVRH